MWLWSKCTINWVDLGTKLGAEIFLDVLNRRVEESTSGSGKMELRSPAAQHGGWGPRAAEGDTGTCWDGGTTGSFRAEDRERGTGSIWRMKVRIFPEVNQGLAGAHEKSHAMKAKHSKPKAMPGKQTEKETRSAVSTTLKMQRKSQRFSKYWWKTPFNLEVCATQPHRRKGGLSQPPSPCPWAGGPCWGRTDRVCPSKAREPSGARMGHFWLPRASCVCSGRPLSCCVHCLPRHAQSWEIKYGHRPYHPEIMKGHISTGRKMNPEFRWKKQSPANKS